MLLELKKDDVNKVGSLLSEIEETPPLVVKESNGTPSKFETLKSLLRDMFKEVIIESVAEMNEATEIKLGVAPWAAGWTGNLTPGLIVSGNASKARRANHSTSISPQKARLRMQRAQLSTLYAGQSLLLAGRCPVCRAEIVVTLIPQ